MAEADAVSIQTFPQTRSITNVWLIGPAKETITGMKLPTNRQVLSVFFNQHLMHNKTIRTSAHYAVQAAFDLWTMANIPTTIQRNAVAKLEKVFDRWQRLKKNSRRRTPTQIQNEKDFQEDMDQLFDIAHANADTMIKIAEDRSFLQDQRGPRIGYMSHIDNALVERTERKLKRKEREDNLRRLEQQRMTNQTKSVYTAGTMADNDEGDDLPPKTSDSELEPVHKSHLQESPPKKVIKQTRPENIVSPNLACALDRANISDRKAMFVIAATAESLGHDVSSLAINRTSIRSARIKFRSQLDLKLRKSFCKLSETSDVPLTVHWDGKILPDLVGHKTVDRLAILVSVRVYLNLIWVVILNVV
jgi:hypothetical protein